MTKKFYLLLTAIVVMATACNHHNTATTTSSGSVPKNAERSTIEARSDLAIAVIRSDPAQVKALLANGANSNETVDGIPLINIATAEAHCSESLIGHLLAHGADPNSTSPLTGITPVMAAAGWANVECFQKLLRAGANLHAVDKSGRNLVAHAAEGGNTKILRILIEAGVALDLKAVQDVTPLMIATYAGHEDFVIELIKSGKIELCARDIRGRSARDMAAAAGHDRLVKLLSECPH